MKKIKIHLYKDGRQTGKTFKAEIANMARDVSIKQFNACKDLFNICVKMQYENMSLTEKVKSLTRKGQLMQEEEEQIETYENLMAINTIRISDSYLTIACRLSNNGSLDKAILEKNVPYYIPTPAKYRKSYPFDTMPNIQLTEIINTTVKLLSDCVYQIPQTPKEAKDKSADSFRFNNRDYFMFEFGNLSVKQLDWFNNTWKSFFIEASEEVIQFNLEKLPTLIAICAFEKGEVDAVINDGKYTPIKEARDDENRFNNWIVRMRQKEALFQGLNISIAYKLVNFFLNSSMDSNSIIQNFTKKMTTTPNGIIIPKSLNTKINMN